MSAARDDVAFREEVRSFLEGALTPDGIDRALHEDVATAAREAAIASGHSRQRAITQRATLLWAASGKGARKSPNTPG